MKPITTLYKGFRMKKRHIGLCLTLLICNVTLSNLKDFSPDGRDFGYPDAVCIDGSTQTPQAPQQERDSEATTDQQTVRFFAVDEKKSEMMRKFDGTTITLRKDAEVRFNKLNNKFDEIFTQNNNALTANQQKIKAAIALAEAECQTTVKQNSATVAQSQQEMNEKITRALVEHLVALEQQKQMSLEKREALEKEMRNTISQALAKHQVALDQQKQMSQEKIADIIGRFDDDKREFLEMQLEWERATLAGKSRLIVDGTFQNKNKNLFFIGGGVAAAVGILGNLLTKWNTIKYMDSKDERKPSFAVFSTTVNRLNLISALIIIGSIGGFTYGSCLQHKDTETLEADAQHAQDKIEELKTMLNLLQTKTQNSQETTAALPVEAPYVVKEEFEAPDVNEDTKD